MKVNFKLIKKFFVDLFKDLVDQAWTLLGMVIAWFVLDGSARDVVGIMILITLAIWVITFPLRWEKEDS
jgi:riboflavin transporter FmnP